MTGGCRALAAFLVSSFAAAAVPAAESADLAAHVAWARLVGYVRFFHPSDQAAACDWNHFALATAGQVGGTQDSAALAARLEALFRPVAPTLRVFPAGQPAPPVPELAVTGDSRVRWLHHGVGLGFGKIYTSERIDSAELPTAPFLEQTGGAPAGARLTATIVTELATGASLEVAWGGATSRFEGTGRHRLDLPSAGAGTSLAVTMRGAGRAWLDGFEAPARLLNPGFEQGEAGRHPPGWTVAYESIRRGYRVDLVRDDHCTEGRQCLQVMSLPYAAPPFPDPSAALLLDLGGGVVAALPTVLPRLAGHTVPAGDLPASCRPSAAVAPREERLAIVAMGWGVLHHFHPRGGAVPESEVLPAALVGALAVTDDEAFRRVLARLAAPFDDPNLRFSHPRLALTAAVPGLWRELAGQVILTAAEGSGLPLGTELRAVEGQPIADVLRTLEAEVSAPSPISRRAVALESFRWGPPGTRLRLTVADLAGAQRDVELARVGYEELEARRLAELGAPLREVAPGVLYADLTRLDTAELEAAAARLAAATGLVFDLRGDAEVGTEVLSHLLDKEAPSGIWEVPVTWSPDHQEVHPLRTVWTIGPRAPRFRARVAFLLDERAFGYTETLLTIAEHQRLGRLVGSPSAGGNGTINRTELPGGFRLTFIGQSVLQPDGTPLQGNGVPPEEAIRPTRAGIAEGRDEVLEAALRVLR